MQFTNKLGLPQYLVDWLRNDNYDYDTTPNTISATGVLKPIRPQILTLRHGDKLTIDVSELIASRYGNAIHDSIERVNTEGVSKEQRIKKKITIEGTEFTVTGKYDLLEEKEGIHTIRDIKTTSVWAYIHGGKDEDYRAQLSIYRWLLHQDKTINPVAYIDFFFTDWQSSKAKMEENYPRHRIHPGYKIELLSLEETEKMIVNKLRLLKEHENTPDNQLPECTQEELWAEEDSWAVYKTGGKRALRVLNSEATAQDYYTQNNIKGHIQHRPGKAKRCKYCPALTYCNQGKRLMEYGLIAD